jgi:hypothetical protein
MSINASVLPSALLSLLVMCEAHAQPTNLGTRPFVVIKSDLTDSSQKQDRIVADFDTQVEASKYASQLAEENTQWMRYAFFAAKRRYLDKNLDKPDAGENATANGGATSRKERTTQLEPTTPSISGQSGSGKFGDYDVTAEFGKDGKLTVSGQANGVGKWTQTGSAIYFETDTSTYRGRIVGDEIFGLRFAKKGNEALMQWRLTIKNREAVEAVVEDAIPPLVGTIWIPSWHKGLRYKFHANQKVTIQWKTLPFGATGDGVENSGTWTQDGDSLNCTFPNYNKSGTIQGNRIQFSGETGFLTKEE